MSSIYVIKATGTNLVKLGFSTNVPKRLKSLQTACPYDLEVLATWPGIKANEKALHLKFAQYRRSGEWFEVGDWLPVLLREIATLDDGKQATSFMIDDVPNALLVLESKLVEMEMQASDPTVKGLAKEGLSLLRPSIQAIAEAVDKISQVEDWQDDAGNLAVL